MKSSVKKIFCIGSAVVYLSAWGYCTKKWVDYKVEKELVKYQKKDKEWTKENFETKIPLEQLVNAFDSTYQVLHEPYYKTKKGKITTVPEVFSVGSGILLDGGYFLTVKHITKRNNKNHIHPIHGLVKYDHNKLFIIDKIHSWDIRHSELEKIFISENFDYALLKVKDTVDLPYYSPGLNIPNEIKVGLQSAAIGFPLNYGRNMRLGNVSQIDSDVGIGYLTFKNSIIPGDSGGPIFVVEDGKIKLTAISGMSMGMESPQGNKKFYYPLSIGYGLKIETILKDIRMQLRTGHLNEKTTKEIKNFLKLNSIDETYSLNHFNLYLNTLRNRDPHN